MAGAGARGAAGRGWFGRWRNSSGGNGGLPGNVKVIAAPAYRRLLASERYLKRAIPVLIVIFLMVIAATRAVSLMSWRDSIESNARALLALSSLQMAYSADHAENGAASDPAAAQALIYQVQRLGALTTQ